MDPNQPTPQPPTPPSPPSMPSLPSPINPNVVVTGQSSPKPSLLTPLPKLLLAILILAILFEIGIFIKNNYLSKTNQANNPAPVTTNTPIASGASISLISDKTEYKVTDQIPVSVVVDTAGEITEGTDVIIHYDPKIFDVLNPQNLKLGQIYTDFPLASVDTKNGVISVSGTNSLSKTGFKGRGEMFSFVIKPKSPAQQTSISIDFKPGSTTNSNIVAKDSLKQDLKQVNNLNLTIK